MKELKPAVEVLEIISSRLWELYSKKPPEALYPVIRAHNALAADIQEGNAAGAAVVAYRLAVEICKLEGSKAAEAIIFGLERHDAMAVEISGILTELANKGAPMTPAVVWQELRGRCGKDGSCCAAEETCRGKPAIVWFGVQGDKKHLTFNTLKERLRRLKTR